MKFSFIIAMMTIASALLGQELITGTVTIDGDTVPGVTILNKTTGQGSITDATGNYNLLAAVGDKIEVSFLGYRTARYTVNESLNYSIDLLPDAQVLNEVVITALGLERQSKDLGYSVQQLSSKEIASVKSTNFVDNLAGKLAGVTISQGATGVGSTSKIHIRGESSFTNNNPLFVIDGIPISNETVLNVTNEAAAGFQEVDFGNGAMDISADDVESISVLKGPAAAALYGTRASNGVIVVKTKDGSQTSDLGVSVASSFTLDNPFRLPQFQNTYGQGNSGQFEFVDGLGGGTNDNITYSYGPQLDIGLNVPQYDSPVTLPDGQVVRGGDVAVHGGQAIPATPFISQPDNLKNFYETGHTLSNHVAFGQSNTRGNYRLSFTDMRSESYIPGVNLDRQTATARLGFRISKKLRVNASGNYVRTTSDNRPASGYGSENINYSLVAWLGRQTNLEPMRDYWQPGLENLQQYSFNYTFFDNPYFILLENRNGLGRNRLFGHVEASYALLPNLQFKVRSGLDNLGELRTFRRAFSSNRFKDGAYAEHRSGFTESNHEATLRFDQSYGKIDLGVTAGANRMDQQGLNTQTQAIGLAQPGVFSLSNAATPLQIFQNNFSKRINSVFGLVQLGFDDKLFVDITGRNDWSSALATPESTDGVGFFYPSVSVSAVISSMLTMPSSISFAKLRASFAQVGNDTAPYQTAGVFLPQTPVNGAPTFTDQNFIANAGLQPELQTAYEIGADIRFFDDLLSLDVAYYNTVNTNQIISLPIAVSSGYQESVVNGGKVSTNGLEATIGLRPKLYSKVKWSGFLNFSTWKSIVSDLPGSVSALTLAYSRVYDNPNQTVWSIVQEGGEVGDIWGTGYLKNENGDFVIGDDGLLIVDNSLKKLGNYNPDFILGMSNTLSYGNLSLDFTLDWRQGGQIISRTQALAGVGGQLEETEFRPEEGLIFDGVVNTGTEDSPVYVDNTQAINPETYYRQFYDRNHEENNMYDASYLKLRQAQLSYDFENMKSGFLSGLKLSIIGHNLLAFSQIPHFDPEQIAVQGNTFISGVEDMSYPTARSIGVSLNATF